MGLLVDWNWQRNESLNFRKNTTETPKIEKERKQRLKENTTEDPRTVRQLQKV